MKLRKMMLIPAIAIAVFSIAAPPASAQSELPGVFGEVIDVRVVNLEVVVTDRDGNRVSGLAPDEFRLRVDGEEVPIDYFTEVRGGTAVAATSQGTEGLPTLAPGQPVGTSYLVFIDDFFSIARDRNRVLDRLAAELPLLGPEDRMAVVAYDGRNLDMLTSWTSSISALERAFKEAKRRKARGLEREMEQRSILNSRDLRRLTGGRQPTVPFGLNPDEREYARLLGDQIKREVAAASATLRSFAKPPGRKVMLLLSGGWPFDPATFSLGDLNGLAVTETEVDRGYELFQPLTDTANLLGYTLYPIDVPGLQPQGPDASTREIAQPGELTPFSQEQEVHSSLTYLAARTGGRALLNSASMRAFGRVAEDTRSYYWLGFTPTWARDDQPHRIKIDVQRPGLRVRSRQGYLDLSRQSEVSAMVESTLLFGNSPNEGGLPIEVGSLRKAGRNRVEVPLSLGIPAAAVTFLPTAEGFAAELELRIAVLDDAGSQAEIPVIPLRIDSAERPTAGAVLTYDTAIKLRNRKHEMVVAVFDPASGRILSNRLEVSP